MVDILTPVNYPGGPYGRDNTPYLLAAMPQPIRQDVWDWLRSRGLLYDGAPWIVPFDNWKPYVKGGWGGGGGAVGPTGPTGPQGPTGATGFSDFHGVTSEAEVTTNLDTFQDGLNFIAVGLVGGNYMVNWACEVHADAVAPMDFQVDIIGTVRNSGLNISDVDYRPYGAFYIAALPAGNNNFIIQYRTTVAGQVASMRRMRLALWLVT